ncbi:MAG: sensor histidine kinase [Clostridiaceae bacterium]
MEDSLLITKFAILFYTIINFSLYNDYSTKDKYYISLIMLLYIILNILIYIIKIKYRKIITLCIVAFLYYISLRYSQYIFLLPIGIYELFEKNKTISPLTLIVLFPMSYLPKEIAMAYLAIVLVLFLEYKIIIKNSVTISELKEINKKLNESNYKLIAEKNNNEDYEMQHDHVIKLQERNKIAQELHDKVGHTISASIMQLEASKLVAKSDKEKAEHLVDNVIKVLREGMDSIRLTLRNLKPPQEILGINKIKLSCKEFELQSEVNVNFSINGDINLITPKYFKIIQDNLKEGFTNITKYSSATEVEVKLVIYNKFIRFEIKDNGEGCSNIIKGLGLRGMEERVENAGGTINFICENGFSVVVVLPL